MFKTLITSHNLPKLITNFHFHNNMLYNIDWKVYMLWMVKTSQSKTYKSVFKDDVFNLDKQFVNKKSEEIKL